MSLYLVGSLLTVRCPRGVAIRPTGNQVVGLERLEKARRCRGVSENDGARGGQAKIPEIEMAGVDGGNDLLVERHVAGSCKPDPEFIKPIDPNVGILARIRRQPQISLGPELI